MSVARKLFYKNLITRNELKEMHEMLVKKYHPYIGELLSAKELIN
ncbi:SHOCT domain-containing protein [uncultured Granulicatella sp.]